jgi:hypothetical protein
MKFENLIFLILLFNSCIESMPSGELGGWDNVVFQTSEAKLKKAVDSLYKIQPKYKLTKWKYEAKSWVQTYKHLRITMFYFHDVPEEMYYVTFVDSGTGDNPNYSRLAIRGVENGKGGWKRYVDLPSSEQLRIAKRFNDEIIKPLEHMLRTETYVEKSYR